MLHFVLENYKFNLTDKTTKIISNINGMMSETEQMLLS